jgi:tetratricopeptide (TPR) repeat protein
MVLTDTGRPINLHSMFESSALRAKERRMREALYGSEEDLRSLCDEWKSDYLLYQANLLLDTSTESYRYMADRLRLPATSVAVALHFFPERLRHFALVYQDSYYRLFRVARGEAGGQDVEDDEPPLPYEEIFDPSPLGALGDTYPDELTERVLARQSARLTGAERGIAARASGDAREAEALFRRVLSVSRDAVEAEIPLAMLLIEEGRLGEADSLVERSLATRPEYAELRYVRGLVHERRGQRDEAIAAFREALAISPGAAPARERLRALGAD